MQGQSLNLMKELTECFAQLAVAEAAQRPDAGEHKDSLQHRLQLLLRLALGPGVVEYAEMRVEYADEAFDHELGVAGNSGCFKKHKGTFKTV